MVEKRVGTTRQAAQYFGFTDNHELPDTRTFKAWADDNKLTPIHGKKHHLWWDFKAISQCLDKKSEIESSEPDYDQILKENLYGERKSGLPHYS